MIKRSLCLSLTTIFASFIFSFSAYANAEQEFSVSSLPSVLESGEVRLSQTFTYSTANTYSPHSFKHFIKIVDSSRGGITVDEFVGTSSVPSVSGLVSLRPGVYRITSGYSFKWTVPAGIDASKTYTVSDTGPSRTLTVTGVPDGVYQVYPDPLVSNIDNCNQDFSLYWEKDVDPEVISAGGKVFYTLEEESVSENAEFSGNWVTLEASYPSVENDAATRSQSLERYVFSVSKAPGRKYRYRVTTRNHVGQFQSRAIANHQGFGSLRKGDCSQSETIPSGVITSLEDKAVLDIAPVSTKGVSLNRITDFGGSGFNVINQPLVIRNFANQDGKAAELIVIETSAVDIRRPISIMGQNAALLIINNNNSSSASSRCVEQCEFHNVNRVTLANAWSDNNYGAGSLQLNNRSKMIVNGLLAPGAHSIDLMAGDLNVEGFISSNLRARKNAFNGQYELSESGQLTAGVGAVNIFSGGVIVEYASLNIERVRPLDTTNYDVLGQTTINGNIEAAAVSVVSTENVTMGANVNTDVDVVLATPYKKKSYIAGDIDKLYTPVERVRLETFGRRATFNMLGAITTKAAASILSNNHLNIKNNISAQSTTLVAGELGKLFVAAGVSIASDSVNAAADIFENNGLIAAKNFVDIGANIALINQYGGLIQSPSVTLTSSHGYVRNGSLVPFKVVSGEVGIDGGSVAGDYQGGTYYELDKSDANSSNVQKVDNLSAKIVASHISISAATSVENINPYFVVNKEGDDWSDSVPFSKRLSQQVGIYATRDIDILAGNKILNSSAEILQLDPAGHMTLVSKNIINQRYRTEVILGNYTYDRIGISTNVDCSGRPDCSTYAYREDQTLSANPVLYSPPGRVYVAGGIDAAPYDSGDPLILKTLNDASYVEVMGNANFYGTILSMGILDYGIRDVYRYDGCNYYGARGPGDPGGCSSSTWTDASIDYLGELDALFRVHGVFQGPEVEWVENNGDAVLGFIARATGTSVSTLQQKVANNTFEDFIKNSFDRIVEYIETFMNSLLNAWDIVTDWFA